MGLDVGPKTLEAYAEVVRSAKTLLWNGPLGVFELEPFAQGTRGLGEAIAAAKRPLILAGHGVLIAQGERELLELARQAQIPIAWTLLGIGVVDETDPLAYGYMGMHGWKHVNRAIQSSDLLIGIGMRYDDRVTGNVRTFAPSAKIVHIDIDPAEIGKNVVADIPIVGDAKRVLEALLPMTERV